MEDSRQVQRAQFRDEVKRGNSIRKLQDRKTKQKFTLERQTRREKSGEYSGLGVKAYISPSRSRKNTRTVKKGQAFARILSDLTYVENDREFTYHATKGWRSHRV